jgi:hypothetical protein
MFDVGAGRKLLVTLAVALLAAGCGGGGGTSAPPPAFDGDQSQVLTITIRNERLNVARVSLWIAGVRERLGDVRSNQTATYHVPMQRREPVRMSFDLELGTSCVTQDVILGPGEDLEVRIPANLSIMRAVCSGR